MSKKAIRTKFSFCEEGFTEASFEVSSHVLKIKSLREASQFEIFKNKNNYILVKNQRQEKVKN